MTQFAEAHPLFAHLDEMTEVVPVAKGRLPSYMRDHRQRLRRRFVEGGAQAMPD